MKRIISTAICFAVATLGIGAHEIETHANLTKAALQYLSNTGMRPGILQLYANLVRGARDEDAYLPGYPSFPYYLGRFFFHFYPALQDDVLEQSADCSSVMWGIIGNTCTATTFNPPDSRNATARNGHSWNAAITAAGNNFVPTALSWEHLGYVIHLLEDLSSPPHTRNSAHPCLTGIGFCDPFESDNNHGAIRLPDPSKSYVDLQELGNVQDFFTRLQDYTRANYFSRRTVFNGNGGPSLTANWSDSDYFYGPCLPASVDFGTCHAVQVGAEVRNLRKIAHKGGLYKITGNPDDATIDAAIAHEQFQELGPVTVQVVAELIKYFAPVVQVKVTSTVGGTVSVLPSGATCTASCAALFVRGANVTLLAHPPSGYEVRWQGDCRGSANPLTLELVADLNCEATFVIPPVQIFSATCTSSPPYQTVITHGAVNDSLVGAIININITVSGLSGNDMDCGSWTRQNQSTCRHDSGQPDSTEWVHTTTYFAGFIPNPIGVRLSEKFVSVAEAFKSYTCP